MDYCVQLALREPERRGPGAAGLRRRPRQRWSRAWAARPARDRTREDRPARCSRPQAWRRSTSVPVVVEVILEKVTNIAMGTEIDKIIEFEEIDCRHPEGRHGLELAGLLERAAARPPQGVAASSRADAEGVLETGRPPCRRFAANLTMLFNEVPFLDRFERAAKAGFEAVEFLFPYAFERARTSRQRLDAQRPEAGAAQPAGRRLGRRRARHRLPSRTASTSSAPAWRGRSTTRTRSACRSSTAWPASCPAGVAEATLRATFVANLRVRRRRAARRPGLQAADRADQHATTFPASSSTAPRRRSRSSTRSARANAFVQYDIYHAQRMEGELAATLQKHLARIGHIQLADNPGRNEPGTGEINYALPVRAPRPHRLPGLDRLRVQAGGRRPRRAWAGGSSWRS